jgi:hypothetical protein
VPNDVNLLPLVIPLTVSESGKALKIGAASKRIPEIIENRLKIASDIEGGKLLNHERYKAKLRREATPAIAVTDATSAVFSPPGSASSIKEARAPTPPEPTNPNGVPMSVISELEKSVQHPILTSTRLISRNHLKDEDIAKVPEGALNRIRVIREGKMEEENYRLARLEAKEQSRMLVQRRTNKERQDVLETPRAPTGGAVEPVEGVTDAFEQPVQEFLSSSRPNSRGNRISSARSRRAVTADEVASRGSKPGSQQRSLVGTSSMVGTTSGTQAPPTAAGSVSSAAAGEGADAMPRSGSAGTTRGGLMSSGLGGESISKPPSQEKESAAGTEMPPTATGRVSGTVAGDGADALPRSGSAGTTRGGLMSSGLGGESISKPPSQEKESAATEIIETANETMPEERPKTTPSDEIHDIPSTESVDVTLLEDATVSQQEDAKPQTAPQTQPLIESQADFPQNVEVPEEEPHLNQQEQSTEQEDFSEPQPEEEEAVEEALVVPPEENQESGQVIENSEVPLAPPETVEDELILENQAAEQPEEEEEQELEIPAAEEVVEEEIISQE